MPSDFVSFTVKKFTDVHKVDKRTACMQLVSAFITCFSIMCPEDREKCCICMGILIKDISTELFEDGRDFVDFIKEKSEEHRMKGDFANDQDADSK